MYIKRLILVVLLSSHSLSADSSPAASHKINDVTTRQLDLQLSKNAERYGIVGQAVRILKNNQVIYDGTNGFSNIELSVLVSSVHRFPSYSVTKLFTSVLLMQLVEGGDVELHQSIRKYLPTLPEHWQGITVEHALSHTSGVPRYMNQVIETDRFLLTKKAVFSSLRDQPEHFKRGSKNSYNNTNFLILSAILESITGNSYSQMVQDIIIKPLNLMNTGHASAKKVIKNMVSSYASSNGSLIKNRILDWPEYSFSHSALYSTPADLTTFMSALVTGKFVKKSTLTKLWQPMKLNSGKEGRYAFGFEYKIEDGFKQVGHDGGNRVKLRHYFSDDLQDSYTIAYMTNGSTQDVWTDILADSLMAIIDKKQFVIAKLSQQFVTHALASNADELDFLYDELSKTLKGDIVAIERFIINYSYAIRYSVGAKESIAAFQFYTRKFTLSANAWDSLAETWQALGNKEKAIQYYEKVLTIDATSANAKNQLKKLMTN